MKHRIKKTQIGFSLVETLVAISILLISITAPLTIASKSLQNNYLASEQLTGLMLAQEGIEAITSLQRMSLRWHLESPSTRDPWQWYADLPANCKGTTGSPANGCPLDVRGLSGSAPVVVGNNNCSTYVAGSNVCRLWRNDAHLRSPYSHDPTNATSTPYSRFIRVNDAGGGNTQQVIVESEVRWETPLFPDGYSIILRAELFNTATTTI